eukprot:Lankesteria_metandrocarpae@DN4117_c0_g1_i1.p1
MAANNESVRTLTEGLLNNPSNPLTSGGISTQSGQINVYPVRTIGVPKETYTNECRVSCSPENVAIFTQKHGYSVLVEASAGTLANFPDKLYEDAGAKIVSRQQAFECDVVLKVRAPAIKEEVQLFKAGALVFSFVYPAQNPDLIKELSARKISLFGMDCIPRITRAQVYDALSSMANIAGYKAVLSASSYFGRFMSGQMTAAGRMPPAKVLVIGGGVAGLSAIVTAKNMGAIVRCFDTRPAVKTEVESLGAEFLEVKGVKLEAGDGGYAKEMTPEFIKAEMALFAAQCREVDIVITTALIPGRPAPRLITKQMVESMRFGSVVVDLAAEMGGNIETTKKDEVHVYNGVTHIGWTDLPSRMATQASRLYANNLQKLVLSMQDKETKGIVVDLTDDVTRGCIVLKSGEMLWPPPKLPGPPAQKAPKVEPKVEKPVTPFRKSLGTATATSIGLMALIALNMLSSTPTFVQMVTVFVLAGTAGYQAVWGVTPSLHTPLMSVTNAISGITAVGGLLLLGQGGGVLGQALAWTATCVSCINIFGGFLITKRMLDMFRRPSDPREHSYLYNIPVICLIGLYACAKLAGYKHMESMAYVTASLCCISSIGSLATQKSARFGISLGMTGVATGIVVTIGWMNYSTYLLTVAFSLMAVGAVVGLIVGRTVQVTDLPQTVAAFHSLVGLAAMVTSISHSSIDPEGTSLDMTSAYLGTLIGGITLTGSIVAFGKLHAIMSSKALCLPGKNFLNILMLCCVISLFPIYMKPGYFFPQYTAYAVVMYVLAVLSVISLLLGWHLVASVGGGDMPVCITVLNSYSGWALVAEGFMLSNVMLTIVGSLIGFSGGILSYIMCKAMNRSLANVLFGGYATVAASKKGGEKKEHRETSVDETVDLIANSRSIIVVPGYGMAVAKAQYAMAELTRVCRAHNISIKFGIHPVAGRMPGQMNVLLAEAGVPYDWVFEMEELNDEFASTDLTLVCGANDITNSAAEEDPTCSIAGMPVLQVWKAKNCVFMKRTMGGGYADLDNPVFYKEGTLMLLGDAKSTVEHIATKLKAHWDV